MPDFVPGDVLETRRGGVDVLRHLARELATLERHGSIRILRNVPGAGERVGHLLIFDGTLAAAFHEADAKRYGIEALLEIESDAAALDAQMSLHELSEASYIATLSEHPSASLITSEDEEKDEAWWTTIRTTRQRIDREDRLPELKPSVPVPEALRRKSEARLKNRDGPVLMRGQAWLENTIEPDEIFKFASVLCEMQQPIQVISRRSPTRIDSTYNVNMEHYRWLSESEQEHTLEPSLETIRQTIEQFFSEHKSCILIFEGIEYLSGIHGEVRVIEMIRNIVDRVRLDGNICIVSSNLEAFTLQQRTRLERELRELKSEQLSAWLLDIDLLQDHPYFIAIDEEVESVLAQHIDSNVKEPVFLPKIQPEPTVEQIPLPIEHQTRTVDDELKSKMKAWANDDSEDIEEHDEPKQPIEPEREEMEVPVRAPRTPQRIVRKRKYIPPTSKQNTMDAAANRNVAVPIFEDVKINKPFVPIPTEKHHSLPQAKQTASQGGMRQAAASASAKKHAQFPPIASTRQLAIPLPQNEKLDEPIDVSPHAREHASVQQKKSEEPNSEEDA
ncbi:MAG: DUF835 domain-containing protein [Candidatus Thermoplasmatota archaeon]|nr:DUF835 domain-containing protein [Candidatus Thermoplasmatota archaeon]MEC8609880.1 DUF835 domain-containing protein [Candidatus Thermoplasmatota archaeon]